MREPVFTETLQVAMVVRDLEATMKAYVDDYGIGPWQIYEFDPSTVEGMVKDDEPAEYAFRIAVTMVGSVQWELIEPGDDKSMYAEFLREHGEGLHHVAVATAEGFDSTIAAARSKGHNILQGGLYNGVKFAYLSTDRDLKAITEIFDWPEGHTQEPDAVYPPG
jgi:methylmalonyl-CoA/ethylmalonyl-CoA epimerase